MLARICEQVFAGQTVSYNQSAGDNLLPSTYHPSFRQQELGSWITPLVHMDRLRAELGGAEHCPRLWIKREDLTGLAGGGNKVRKLECIMGHALSLGADVVINTGGIQSNQARQTAGAAARLGLECHLVLARQQTPVTPIYEETGNILICRILGAHIHIIENDADRNEVMKKIASDLRDQGRRPYIIPTGASTREGVLGSARCGEEIFFQARKLGFNPDWIVCAVGSSGTCAGLYAGIHAALLKTDSTQPVSFLGVDILGRAHAMEPESRLWPHVLDACELLEVPVPEYTLFRDDMLRGVSLPAEATGPLLEITGGFTGDGYARPYREMVESILLVARSEGILLDPVYTGKTMTAMISAIRNGFFQPTQNVVFFHSGGQYALFAYPSLFEDCAPQIFNSGPDITAEHTKKQIHGK